MLNKSNLLYTLDSDTLDAIKYYNIAYKIGLDDSDNMVIKYYNEFSLKSEVVTFEKELESRNIIDEVENLLKDYVLEHFNRYDIQEMGSCIYNVADEKAYDLLCNYIDELHENYYFDEEEYDVDNYAEGGSIYEVDLETGVVCSRGKSKAGDNHIKHPGTDIIMLGYQIPNWDKVMEASRKAAEHLPQVGIIGWDVAVTESGTDMIEGNHNPDYEFYEYLGSTGYYEVFKNIIK